VAPPTLDLVLVEGCNHFPWGRELEGVCRTVVAWLGRELAVG
jgi:hypothetical protein